MTHTISKALLILIAGVFIACSASEESEPGETEQAEADPMPQTKQEFVEQASFTTLDGDTVSVTDFKGKVLLLDFWETWCKPCLASFPTLQELQEEYPDRFAVLAVTPGFTDTADDARAFAEDHDYTFEYLLDVNRLHERLEIQGIPYKVFVDADGNFIKESVGSHGPKEDYKRTKKIIEEHTSVEEKEPEAE